MWTVSTLPTHPGNPARNTRALFRVHCPLFMDSACASSNTHHLRSEANLCTKNCRRTGTETNAHSTIVGQCAPLARRLKLAISCSRGGTLLLFVRLWKSPGVVISSSKSQNKSRGTRNLCSNSSRSKTDGFRRSRYRVTGARSPYPTRHTSARGPPVHGTAGALARNPIFRIDAPAGRWLQHPLAMARPHRPRTRSCYSTHRKEEHHG